LFCSNGILFNHESPRRGPTFVTRKITRAAARIKLGLQTELTLGNLNALRDWGHSKDYMKAVHLILQQDKPDDYVVATGEQYSVRSFVDAVFNYFNLDSCKYLNIDDDLKRPNEVPDLLGNSSKIRSLGWKPEYNFESLVAEMCESDLKLERDNAAKQN
jgi:GDPmannose 4,6-dehydratase